MRLERIELFQLHRIDPKVPEADQFGVLQMLLEEGKIARVGLSEVDVAAIARARQTLPIVSVQNKYNVSERTWDAVVSYCDRERIAFIPWYPLGAGDMTGRAVQNVAARHGATPLQVALAWLLARSPMMLPIPGTSKVKHLEENATAASLELTPEDLAELG